MTDGYTRIGYFTGQPASLDPFRAFDPDSYTVIMACHDSLTYVDQNGELLPSLACAWRTINPLCYEFDLRKDVFFHNGEVFNALAVKATLDAQRDPNNHSPTGQAILSAIKSTEIVDEYKVRIHTVHPDAMLPWRLCMFSAMVPPLLLEKEGISYFKNHPVGTGPFIFESMIPGKELVYRANEKYWRGKPKTAGFKFIILPAQYWLEALKDDKLDMVYGLHEVQMSLLKKTPDITINTKLSALSHWFLLSHKGPLADKRIRVALNLAIDNNIIARIQSNGTAIPQKCIGTEGQFGYNPEVTPYPFDPDKARTLLREAGYENGFHLKGLVADHSASLVQIIAAYLADINVVLEYDIVPRTVWVDSTLTLKMSGGGTYSGDFAVAPIDNPIMYTGFHHYIFLASDGPFSLIEDTAFMEKFIEAMTAPERSENESQLKALDQYVHNQALLLFTVQSSIHLATRSGISMEISNNGHFDSFSWLTLEDRRSELSRPNWDFGYMDKNEPIIWEEFRKVLEATEHSSMFYFPNDEILDPRLRKLVQNLRYFEDIKLSQERGRFEQIVGFLHKVRDLDGLLDASRFSGIATYDLAGNLLLYNNTFVDLLGDTVPPKYLYDLFKDEADWYEFRLKLEEEKGYFGSIDFVKSNGISLAAQIACSVRLGGVGEPIGFLLIARDESHERFLKIELEKSHSDLENKVVQRTAELKNTLEIVQNLKLQQDGDYFLINLLTATLSNNTIKSNVVQIEFLTEQKKKFDFKNKKYEIGGDINIAHSIVLCGQTYSVIVNADAMGKSIQGAGGILVLGSVFQTIINRTLKNEVEQSYSPERWLYNTVSELNATYESFNGSMLVSLIVGLIQDDTGLLYYLRMDHPPIILLRNKKAVFLTANSFLHKLGTLPLPSLLRVEIFQLLPNDILIMGSDGKDDLLLHGKENREINTDENLFLTRVEENSDLAKIHKSLLDDGELIDDLSLLKITYKPEAQASKTAGGLDFDIKIREIESLLRKGQIQPAMILLLELHHENPKNLKILRRLIKYYLAIKDYETALKFIEPYINLDPGNTELFYVASRCFQKTNNLEKAIELGERIVLRNPSDNRFLVHQEKNYTLAKAFDKAKIIRDIRNTEV